MKVKVDRYPFEGVVGFQVEEYVYGEWVSLLDTSSVGSFPNYTTTFTVTPYATNEAIVNIARRYRARWEIGDDQFSPWFIPTLIKTLTAEQTERVVQAIIQKATRFYLLTNAPFGTHGVNDFGPARVMDDRQVEELLLGLRFQDWDLDLTSLTITASDVVRVGLQSNDTDFKGDTDDVDRALDAALSWVDERLSPQAVGIA